MLSPRYNPQEVEQKIYQNWLDNNYFNAAVDKSKKPFTIIMPPPNITGQLHMGHALDNTIQDVLIRFKRMQGFSALWMPGTDHASIATEMKIVEDMKSENLTKADLGREKFLDRAWEWKEKYGSRIIDQLKRLGCSCDFERERFTLDDGCSKAVLEVFVKMYRDGLIQKSERMINWCCDCETSISDAEVEHAEKQGKFWHIKYPFEDGSGHLILATTRPETLLGDTAVAVNPNDERYKNLVGKNLILPLCNRTIPIIADDYVEMDFGTGVVKITPAHDPNDFEVGARHNLEIKTIMNERGVIANSGTKYDGLDRFSARKAILADLDAENLLEKTEDNTHNVGECYRCKQVVEPRVSLQWFVKMSELAKPAIEAVTSGKIKFVTDRFKKVYLHWMENIKDWCISRQLWWGHRIPAWYCSECEHITVSVDVPTKCEKCNSTNIKQDEDTLDTWFSSALWPFSTLGWPEKTAELDYFYPTQVMVTGYDIIFFWVARMIFSSLYNLNEIPFETIYIHGLVRDENGLKMSKSLGNGVEPIGEIDQYGADALRLALLTNNSPGNDMRYSKEKIESSRNFANKIFNAARFILMNVEDKAIDFNYDKSALSPADAWILSRVNLIVDDVTKNIENYELGLAVDKIHTFLWDEFCDWYIEIAKVAMQADDEKAATTRAILIDVLKTGLKLLHPFMPFITEEIWSALPQSTGSLMVSDWPIFNKDFTEINKSADEFEKTREIISAIRSRRAEMNVPPSKKSKIIIAIGNTETINHSADIIAALAKGNTVEICTSFEKSSEMAEIITPFAKIYLPMDELVDLAAENARKEKIRAEAEKTIAQCENKLKNQAFVDKAPPAVIEKVKAELHAAKEILQNL